MLAVKASPRLRRAGLPSPAPALALAVANPGKVKSASAHAGSATRMGVACMASNHGKEAGSEESPGAPGVTAEQLERMLEVRDADLRLKRRNLKHKLQKMVDSANKTAKDVAADLEKVQSTNNWSLSGTVGLIIVLAVLKAHGLPHKPL